MFKSTSTSMIAVGVLAIIAGIVALVWPGVTVLVLVILFAVYAFSDAVLQGARAFSSDGFGPVLGHLLLALVDIAAGVFALAWPAPTVLVLVYVVGFWAIFGGFAEFFSAFAATSPPSSSSVRVPADSPAGRGNGPAPRRLTRRRPSSARARGHGQRSPSASSTAGTGRAAASAARR